MLRLIKYLLYSLLAIIICVAGSIAWQADREEERTVNLVEQTPELFPKVCELHGLELQWDRVGISYGLVLYGPNEKESFPHSNKWVSGGCVGGGPRYGWVL